MENDAIFSRTEFMERVRQFTDSMVNRVNERSKGKDVDDRDIGMLGNIVLKSLKLWKETLTDNKRDHKLKEEFLRLEKQATETGTKS